MFPDLIWPKNLYVGGLSGFHLLDQYLPTYYAGASRYETQRVVQTRGMPMFVQRVSCWRRVMKTSRDVFCYLIRFLLWRGRTIGIGTIAHYGLYSLSSIRVINKRVFKFISSLNNCVIWKLITREVINMFMCHVNKKNDRSGTVLAHRCWKKGRQRHACRARTIHPRWFKRLD